MSTFSPARIPATPPGGDPSATASATDLGHDSRPVHTAIRAGRRVPLWWADASASALWLLLLAVTALWISGGGIQSLTTLGEAETSVGRLTGLIASALLLVQVFLMARVPAVERAWGQDRLARAHRVVGFWSLWLMVLHIVLITLGYTADSTQTLWGTVVDFTLNYPGMLLAIAGTAALVMVVVTSIRAARARLRYESWHLIHLYGYLGAGLALPHQLWTGQDFQSSPLATLFWWTLYIVAAGAVVLFRLALPAWRSLRAPIRVAEVRPEGTNAVTVTVAGRGVERLHAEAGQFFQWRFLDGPGWTRAHPFSLSAAPDGKTLSFTAAVVGDGTDRLTRLRPGTRVLVEGPYGRMHDGVRTRGKVLLIGAGIGITPMKSLLEALPAGPGDITVIHRVSDAADPLFRAELTALAAQRQASYVRVAGGRRRDADSWLPASTGRLDDAEGLLRLCPDVADRDVYLCGHPAWMDAARQAALRAGVPATRIHDERFSL